MGVLRDQIDTHYNNLLDGLIQLVEDEFTPLEPLTPTQESDKEKSIDFYREAFNELDPDIITSGLFGYSSDVFSELNNFFNNKSAELSNLYQVYIVSYMQSKKMYRIDLPDTSSLDTNYTTDFLTLYTDTICSYFLTETSDDLFGGVFDNSTPTTPIEPDGTALEEFIDGIPDMLTTEIDTIGGINPTDNFLNIGIQIQYIIDAGRQVPLRDLTGSPFTTVDQFLDDKNIRAMIEEFSLSVTLPEDVLSLLPEED